MNLQFFCDRGPSHIETSPRICRANQWTGFYIIGTSIMNELKHLSKEYTASVILSFLKINSIRNKFDNLANGEMACGISI